MENSEQLLRFEQGAGLVARSVETLWKTIQKLLSAGPNASAPIKFECWKSARNAMYVCTKRGMYLGLHATNVLNSSVTNARLEAKILQRRWDRFGRPLSSDIVLHETEFQPTFRSDDQVVWLNPDKTATYAAEELAGHLINLFVEVHSRGASVYNHKPAHTYKRVIHRSREEFLQILPRHSVGAELGAFKGEFTEKIISTAKPREFHVVDAWWILYGEYYPDWGKNTDYGRLKTKDAYRDALSAIAPYRTDANIVVHICEDLEYLASLPDRYLDWSYLDTAHSYEQTKLELEMLKAKTRTGGLITGHDWFDNVEDQHHDVYRAVTEFCEAEKWCVVLVDNHSQWAIRRR